jgi:ribosomal protein L27
MSAQQKIAEMFQLQSEALRLVARAELLMADSNNIARELGIAQGDKRIICAGTPYIVRYRATGFVPGNSFWLEEDKSIATLV